jgi:hypothetical protein
MRISSARQPEFDFGPITSLGAAQQPSLNEETLEPEQARSDPATSSVIFPAFGGVSSDLYAVASRRAGRINAASISNEELDRLVVERQLLLDKKFNENITRAEIIRLTYVEWQLDRIEDAREGEALDRLESWVAEYERFKNDLQTLERNLTRQKRGSRR